MAGPETDMPADRPVEEEVVVVRRNPWPRRILLTLIGILATILAIVMAAYVWLGTDSGRGFVKKQIEALALENGLRIRMGSIEGSIFGAMRINDLVLRDPEGVFLTAPRVNLDWRPLGYASGHVDVRSLVVPSARLYRLPQFNQTAPSDPDAPLLPDLDIDVGRLEVGRLRIDPPVTGRAHLVNLSGKVHIADGRAQLSARADALSAPGVAGGDRMAIVLDAVPEENRLDIEARVAAPGNGLVAGLAGLDRPFNLTLTGKGDWDAWNGRLAGQSGGDELANVAIRARDGTFRIAGDARPGLFLTGPARGMLEPLTRIDMTAMVERDRRVRLQGGVRSDNFILGTRGLVDLRQSSMQALAIDFQLLKPSVIAENLGGAGLRASVTLNGAFASPRIEYALNAARASFGETVIDGLAVSGSAALDEERWVIPVSGRARRITGVNASVEPLLTNVRIDGDLAYAEGRLLSDNLKLLSDRIDATAIVVADLNEGVYTGGLQGRVNGFQVDSIGIFNLQSDVDLKTAANGGFRLGGRVTARSTRLLNDGIRTFLGGDAVIVADVGYGSDGVATVDRLSIAAPEFRLTGGSARYGSDGQIRFSGRGSSDQYGPLGVEVTGTVARPLVQIAAARPGLGVGLSDVTATVRGTDGVYAVNAQGTSDYGAFTADVDVATAGRLSIAANPGTQFAGVGLTGRVEQTPAGPFAGMLTAAGSGIDGTVDLSAQAGAQRAVVRLAASGTSLPGPAGLSVEQGYVNADILLTEQPQVVADVRLAGTRLGELYISAARAAVDYRGGQGQAKLLVEGRARYPFRMAANGIMQPDLWRLALNGRINGIDVVTNSPIRVVPGQGNYRVLPSTLRIGDQGSIQLAADYGDRLSIQSRLNGVNLALLNPFLPDMGLGGVASGSLDFAQASPSAFPSADARLVINNFTRTSLAAVSMPVDLHVVGRLLPDGGNARAIVRRRGAAIGRMQVDLRPLGPGAGSWTTRLLAAPLSGGIRYNGPADVLFSLAALPQQNLGGPVGVAADFTGRVATPQLNGVVVANNLTYTNAQYGTRLTSMRVRGRFTNDRLQVQELTARAGDGSISGSGFVSLSSAQGFPIQLGLQLDNAQLAEGQDLATRATGTIRVVNGPDQQPTITGRITLPETRYRIVRQGSVEVPRLSGVRRKPALGRERVTGDPEPIRGVPSNWALDVQVVADNQIYVSGMGLNSEWAADIHVGGTSGAPAITGGVELVRGTLGFAGRSFNLESGRIRFDGGPAANPTLRIVASGDVEDVTINVTIAGSAQNPEIAFTSVPSLPQDELMARILFGNSVGELSAIQAVQLAASLNSLRGSGGGLNPLGVLQSSAGIDRLRILGGDEETGRGTAVAVGQYITNDIYVEIVTDARGYTATQLEVALSRALSVLSQVGTQGTTNVGLRYRKDY